MARASLPHRSSLSRFLADVDHPCLEAFRRLFEQGSFVEGWTKDSIGGIWDRQGRRYIVFDIDATRQAARQRALPCDATLPSPRRRQGCQSAHQATKGENEAKSYGHARLLSRCILANGLALDKGRGNGDYRAELASALRAIITYLRYFALTSEVALVRLDGQYGDASVIAQIIQAGVYLVTRGRGYQILEHPQLQCALAR